MTRTAITLSELAARIGAALQGDGDFVVQRVGTLEMPPPMQSSSSLTRVCCRCWPARGQGR